MSIFNENQEKVEGLGVVATALQNRLNSRAVSLDGTVARNVISVESLDDAAKAELKNLGKNAKEALKDVTTAGLGLESYEQAEIPAHCMEAAQVALMGALGGAAEYQAAAYRMDVPSMEGATVFAPAIGGLHGSVDYTTANDQVSLEMFQDVDLNVVASFSATWNLGATRQDSFSEAWFKTIVLTPDQVALDIKVHRTLVQRGVQRKLNGAVSNWRQRNILEAFRDHKVLDTASTQVVPNVLADKSRDQFFVDPALIPSTSLKLDDIEYITRPLAIGAEFDLLAISQHPTLLEGQYDQNDQLDSRVQVTYMYVKVTNTDTNEVSVVKFNTKNMIRSQFTPVRQGNQSEIELNFRDDSLAVGFGTKGLDGANATALAELETAGLIAGFKFSLSGTCDLQFATTQVNAGPTNIHRVHDKDGNERVITDATVAAMLAKLKLEIVGYDVLARRTNSNKRTRGMLVERNYRIERHALPTGAPITVQAPTADATGDAQAMNDLINATRVRNSNMAVTALMNYAEVLKQFVKANPNVAKGLEPTLQLEGAGRWLVDPFFEEVDLDLWEKVNSLKSQDRTGDVCAVIVNTIRDVAYRMMRDSNYLPALQHMSQGADEKPFLLIGTDQILPQYIQIQGDPRTLGINMEHAVYSTPDLRLVNKIYLSFSRQARTGVDLLSTAVHAWMPELVTVGQVSRNGYTVKELQVQPRNLHVFQLPVMALINVKNLEKALTAKLDIPVNVTP